MSAISYTTQSHTCVRSTRSLLAAIVMVLTGASLLHAQSALPTAPSPSNSAQQVLPHIGPSSGFSGTTSGLQPSANPDITPGAQSDSGPSHHQRSSTATPFKLPRTITKTTASGVKFQFSLPRVGFAAGQRPMGGQLSPLDSNSTQSIGGKGSAIFPSDDNFMSPTGTASDGIFDEPSDGMSGLSRGGRGGAAGGARGGAGAPGLGVKSSIFDLHMSLSTKDLMGGSFSQGSGNSSAGASGFGVSDGLHTPGSEGRGSGAKLSLGLRF